MALIAAAREQAREAASGVALREGMRVSRAGDRHAAPFPLFELDLHARDVRVASAQVVRHDERERLDVVAEMLVGEHADRILERIRRDDLRVVAPGEARLEVALEEHAGRDVANGVNVAVAQDLEHPDAALSIAMRGKLHDIVPLARKGDGSLFRGIGTRKKTPVPFAKDP